MTHIYIQPLITHTIPFDSHLPLVLRLAFLLLSLISQDEFHLAHCLLKVVVSKWQQRKWTKPSVHADYAFKHWAFKVGSRGKFVTLFLVKTLWPNGLTSPWGWLESSMSSFTFLVLFIHHSQKLVIGENHIQSFQTSTHSSKQ